MRTAIKFAVLSVAASWACAVRAADVPRMSAQDARIRYVTYKSDDVVVVNVRRGVVTRLILAPDEHIRLAGTGFAAACDKEGLEWCIRAERGSNQIWVKPQEGATHNNIEVQTDRRDYSIRLQVLSDRNRGAAAAVAGEMYRVIFQYSVPPATVAQMRDAGNAGTGAGTPSTPDDLASLLDGRPVVRNDAYTMEAAYGGEAISPVIAFDDGRFTYFRFPGNREIPAPFVIDADGTETRANFHMERGDVMVIQRVAARYVLRLGKSVVGVWNDGWDDIGVPAKTGTASPRVTRMVKEIKE